MQTGLFIAGLVLGIIGIAQSKLANVVAWGLTAVSLGLLWVRF